MEIIVFLCKVRHETYANLEIRFGVSRATIQRDIKALSCSYPIETVRGRYGGGVKIPDWFSLTRPALSLEQIRVLKKTKRYFQGEIDQSLEEGDIRIINSILLQFSPICSSNI